MKNNLTSSQLFRTFCFAIFSIAVLNFSAFAQKTVRKPGKKMHFESDLAGGWILKDHTYYTYDAAGNVTEILNTDSLNSFADRYTIYYDAFGNDTLTIYSVMNNGTVHNYERRNKLTYNNQNQVTEKVYQVVNNSVWEDQERTRYTFANGLLTEKTFERYDAASGNWRNIDKQLHITWNPQFGQISSYTLQQFQNNTWVNAEKHTATFQANGSSVAVTEDWVNNTWQNKFQKTITLDSLKNETNYLVEYWNNNAWTFHLANDQPITYYPNGDIQEQYSSITCVSCSPTGPHKYVYTDYKTFTVTGLKNQIPQEISATIYPNPTTNLLNIELPEKTQNVTAKLTDLTGKVMLNQTSKTSEAKQLNLQTLKPGIYMLSLETENGKAIRKIVKN